MGWDVGLHRQILGAKHPCSIDHLAQLAREALAAGFRVTYCRPGVPRDWRPAWFDHGHCARPARTSAAVRSTP